MTDETQFSVHIYVPLVHQYVAILLHSQQRRVTGLRHDSYNRVNAKQIRLITLYTLRDGRWERRIASTGPNFSPRVPSDAAVVGGTQDDGSSLSTLSVGFVWSLVAWQQCWHRRHYTRVTRHVTALVCVFSLLYQLPHSTTSLKSDLIPNFVHNFTTSVDVFLILK